MRIICINQGTKYPVEYVTRLKRACERHIPHEEFFCMTDQGKIPGVMTVPMNTPLLGWWSKLGLFRRGYFPGDNLFLDLDVVITDSIPQMLDAFYSDTSKLWALDDFSYSLRKPRLGLDDAFKETLGGVGTINSSVMMWNGLQADLSDVYDDFRMEAIGSLHGDQNWLTSRLWDNDKIKLFPLGEAHSFKYGERKPYPITVFHGNPKPHEVPEEWVREAWAA